LRHESLQVIKLYISFAKHAIHIGKRFFKVYDDSHCYPPSSGGQGISSSLTHFTELFWKPSLPSLFQWVFEHRKTELPMISKTVQKYFSKHFRVQG